MGILDLWDRGLVIVLGSFFCGLFTPLTFRVPESQVVSRRTFLQLVAYDYKHYDIEPTEISKGRPSDDLPGFNGL